MIYEPVGFQYSGVVRERAGKRFAIGPFMIVTLKCRDGYAGLQCVTDKQFESLCDLMGRRELATDPRFNTALAADGQQRRVARDRRGVFPASTIASIFIARGRRARFRWSAIPNVAELLEWEQLKSRNYFETIDDPVLGRIRIPGAPLRLSLASAASPRVRRRGSANTIGKFFAADSA